VGGAVTLNILGRGFQTDSTASINGKPHNVQRVSNTLLKLTLLNEDLVAKGELQLIVRAPGAAGESSEPFTIPVELNDLFNSAWEKEYLNRQARERK
jgi:hypothetical protein